MGSFSVWHLLIVLVIVLVIFGPKKLKNVGGDLGAAVKGFKDGMKTADEPSSAAAPAQVSGQTIDAEVKKESSSKV